MKLPTLLKSVARIAALTLISATLLIMILEKRLIYYPSKVVDATPKALGLPFEDLLIDVEAGVKIHAWFIKAATEPPVATLLFSHGNAGNMVDRLDRVLSLRDVPVDLLLYDYRGFGKSTGEPDEEGTYRDGRAAYDYLVKGRHLDPARIILMGESLGCAISLQLAIERKTAGLILEAPFASIRHMAAAVYPFLPLGPFVRTRYDNLAKASKLTMPLLVGHGTKDDVIPVAQGRMVFDAAPEPKRFLAIEGARHNDVYVIGGSAYVRAISEFVHRATLPTRGPVPETRQP